MSLSPLRKLALYVPLALALALITVVSFAGTSAAGSALIGVAHAGTLEPASAAPDTGGTGLGLAGYIVLGVAAIGGLIKVLEVTIGGLKWLAPRTETKADDAALEFAQQAHDRLDELERVLVRMVPTAVERPRGQAGYIRVGAVLILAMLGLSVVAGLSGCATLRSEGIAFKAGAIVCAKADVPKIKTAALELGAEALAQLVLAGKIDADALLTSAEVAGKTQGLEVAACAFGDVVARVNAVLQAHRPSGESARTLAEPDGGLARAFAAFQARHGISDVR